MINLEQYPIADLVPHSGSMRLLDRAIAGSDSDFIAEVTIRPDHLFFNGSGVGAWTGIEYMAQTIAAWAGWHARLQGFTPKIGFLLGSRHYASSVSEFTAGQILQISIHRAFQANNGLGQFDCRIVIHGQEVATAALTVFEPLDANEFLKGQGHE